MYQVTLTESYFPAQNDAPIWDITTGELLRGIAIDHPDAIALVEIDDFFRAPIASTALQAKVIAHITDLALVTVPGFLERTARVAHHRVRASAIEALGRFPTPNIEQLLRALGDEHHRVRANAAIGLLASDPTHERALETITEMLEKDDPIVRRAGLFAASRSAAPALFEHVRRLSKDPDNSVRVAVAMTLFAHGERVEGKALLAEQIDRLGSRAIRLARRMLPFVTSPGDHGLREALEQLQAEIDER